MSPPLSFVVAEGEGGERLDRVIVGRIAGLGRRRAAELFSEGRVTVNGRRAVKGETAVVGSDVVVQLHQAEDVIPEPDAPLSIRLLREDLVIVSKPAGQPTAPLRGEPGTLAAALIGHYPEMAHVGWSRREPGLLHRLDTQTSGLVIAARTPGTFERLRQALTAGEIDKRYLAVVASQGLPDEGVVDAPLGPDRESRRRVRVIADAPPKSRPRSTRFRVLRRSSSWALLEVSVSRAYRHQIRAHLAHLGHPIAGDAVYGGEPVAALGGRHALHASYVAWAGDATVVGFAAEDALPPELGSLIAG